MSKKILKICTSLVLSICIISSAFFMSANSVGAVQTPTESNEGNSLGIVIEETSESLDGAKTSVTPDLGDDQAFPFIPGFGKNSGKD